MHSPTLSASSILKTNVTNHLGEDLGDIKDLMIDTSSGQVEYAVLSFGGFLGMGDKYFAVPMDALDVDTSSEEFKLHADKEDLKDAPGFDKDNWPNSADESWRNSINDYYAKFRRNNSSAVGQQAYAEQSTQGNATGHISH